MKWGLIIYFGSILQPNYSLRSFTGHSDSVLSLDFHPSNEDLVFSCDGYSEIRYWSVSQGACTRKFEVLFFDTMNWELLFIICVDFLRFMPFFLWGFAGWYESSAISTTSWLVSCCSSWGCCENIWCWDWILPAFTTGLLIIHMHFICTSLSSFICTLFVHLSDLNVPNSNWR